MRNSFKVLFYLKRNAPLRNGEAPVMVRITINGQRAQLSAQISVDPELWDTRMGCMTGRSAIAQRTNDRLRQIRRRIESCYDDLFRIRSVVTPQMVRELYFGIDSRTEFVIAFFRRHNEEFGRMVGLNRSKATYYKYRCVCSHLENFIRGKYNRDDLMFKELDREFIIGFHAYVSHECAFRKNTTWIYMIAFKHILALAHGKGYLSRDLFANYKLHSERVVRNHLSINEINNIAGLDLDNRSSQVIRDAFLFSCFTGLSYVDICNLTTENILKESGQVWISTARRKTGTEVNVRLFEVAYVLLSRNLGASCKLRIFDLPSNGWCNLRLREICLKAGIDKRITFHCARHTFATTITLSQGMDIETISKLLGHRNIRTTQIYAAITRSKLGKEMERLSKRIDSLCGKHTR